MMVLIEVNFSSTAVTIATMKQRPLKSASLEQLDFDEQNVCRNFYITEYTPISKNVVATKRLKQQDKSAENAGTFAGNKSIHGVISLLDFTNHSKHGCSRR